VLSVLVNGETVEVEDGLTLAGLVARQTGRDAPLGVAVARNRAVVPRSRWAEEPVEDGDEIELVGVMQGG
jgi:sulfur carrier protein